MPVDYDAPPSSSLNVDWIDAHSANWPDKKFLGFLRDGVNFRAKLPLMFLFSPHLTSLKNGVLSVEKELRRLDVAGYHTVHDNIAFAPSRFMSQGCTARKLEPDRFRRTTDGGCPRDIVCDGDGNQCVSINEAIGLKATEAQAAAYDALHGHNRDVLRSGNTADGVGSQGMADGIAMDGTDDDAAADGGGPLKWKQAEVKPRIEDKNARRHGPARSGGSSFSPASFWVFRRH